MGARTIVTIRVGEKGLEKIDALADQYSSTRSEVVRLMLAEVSSRQTVMEAIEMKLKVAQEVGKA